MFRFATTGVLFLGVSFVLGISYRTDAAGQPGPRRLAAWEADRCRGADFTQTYDDSKCEDDQICADVFGAGACADHDGDENACNDAQYDTGDNRQTCHADPQYSGSKCRQTFPKTTCRTQYNCYYDAPSSKCLESTSTGKGARNCTNL